MFQRRIMPFVRCNHTKVNQILQDMSRKEGGEKEHTLMFWFNLMLFIAFTQTEHAVKLICQQIELPQRLEQYLLLLLLTVVFYSNFAVSSCPCAHLVCYSVTNIKNHVAVHWKERNTTATKKHQKYLKTYSSLLCWYLIRSTAQHRQSVEMWKISNSTSEKSFWTVQ